MKCRTCGAHAPPCDGPLQLLVRRLAPHHIFGSRNGHQDTQLYLWTRAPLLSKQNEKRTGCGQGIAYQSSFTHPGTSSLASFACCGSTHLVPSVTHEGSPAIFLTSISDAPSETVL